MFYDALGLVSENVRKKHVEQAVGAKTMNTEALQVLLVEDDRDLAASVADYLALDGPRL